MTDATLTDGKNTVRETLRMMTATQIQDGMRAFAHPPNGTIIGCFVTMAHMWESSAAAVFGSAWLSWCYEVSPNNENPKWHAHVRYGDLNAWLKGECLRELAERGAAAEPTVPQAQEVGAA